MIMSNNMCDNNLLSLIIFTIKKFEHLYSEMNKMEEGRGVE